MEIFSDTKYMRTSPRVLQAHNNRFNKCLLHKLTIPALVVYAHNTHNPTVLGVGEIAAFSYSVINYALFFVDNYCIQLDHWRDEESHYENKSEPPEPNINIVKHDEHAIRLLGVLSNLSARFAFFQLIISIYFRREVIIHAYEVLLETFFL